MGVSIDIKVGGGNKTRSNRMKANEKKQRAEARRLVSLANKRLRRIEKSGLYSEALEKWKQDGGVKFSVKGKTHKEVQQEMARMRHFIKLESSTVKGAKSVLRKTANLVGITKWENYQQLNSTMAEFFNLSSKIEEYLKNDKRYGVSIGYEKIWEYIANHVEQTEEGLKMAQMNIKEMAEHMGSAILNQKGADAIGNIEDFFI